MAAKYEATLPPPGKSMVTLTDSDGASAWVVGSESTMHDPEFQAQLGPLLEDAMHRLRSEHATA